MTLQWYRTYGSPFSPPPKYWSGSLERSTVMEISLPAGVSPFHNILVFISVFISIGVVNYNVDVKILVCVSMRTR